MRTRTTSLFTLAAAATLVLVGCSTPAAPGAGPDTSASTASASQSAGVTVTDVWVKAAESGMTAAFGVLSNSGTADVTLVSAGTTAAGASELHETLTNEAGEMVMSEKPNGFTIPAGGTLLLEPGANHIMLMKLAGPVTAGTDVSFTLTFSDGSTLEFTAPAKDYSGANENYTGGDEHDMHGDMHGDMHDDTDAGEHGDAHTDATP